MQKDNRYYTFLLSHATKEKIYIRRLEISKKILQTTFASLILCIGLISMGVFGILQAHPNDFLASFSKNNPSQNLSNLQNVESTIPVNEARTIDYSRPPSSEEFALNSGGPSDYRLVASESNSEENEIERKLAAIETKTSPDFLPTIWAHLGKINNEFGFRRNPFGGRSYEFHSGMDIDGDVGDLVVAPANGTVVSSGWQGGYGRMIEIDHGNGLTTRYGHLSRVNVSEGDLIRRGQLIALVGSTGRSTGPHLHYELRLDKKPINPRRFLPPEAVKN